MTDFEDIISTLNHLIETSRDGEEGFRSSAENVDDPQLKAFFIRRSQEVGNSVRELQDLVRSLGGEPATSSTISGALHRRWIDLKTAITSNDIVAVLNETERGEDVALKAYREAVEIDLPAQVRLVVIRQLEGAQRNHDEVKRLRDLARATVE
ncbi:PA2169 family four-helix-bundle protein [Methylophilus aquaticus]|uniref:PA2169 family four-helix-bundle protein n=1 Tax=Methylophilus aquaticus TaxID=1971610 RepID=A0ABT9JRX6_9PROT|nr:PA2169 family four-helix-bundle protein [Methylophilus aquaticus]MDP8567307.1 PA2169 family four-helix-bundle protein [Methylophilus aquaticus]